MKKNLILSALTVILAAFIFGCKKDATPGASEASKEQLQNIERTDGSSLVGSQTVDGVSEYLYTSSSSLEGGRDANQEAFCCAAAWVGLQNFPPNGQGFTFTIRRFNVPGANAYRNRYTVFRNDVLFWTGSFPTVGDSNCPTLFSALVWPNGLGNCCGVFSVTLELQYRIGTTWYTCNAAHGEADYFPAGCGWCE